MASVTVTESIPATAAALWEVIGDFNGMGRYVTNVESSDMEGSGVGAVRSVKMKDGSLIVEKLEHFDDAGRELKYSIVEAPLPVKNYLSTMKVEEAGESCTLTWSSEFEADGADDTKAEKLVKFTYVFGIKGIKKLFA